MAELSRYNPTGRFTGLASLYARCRPDYPAAAIDHILSRCGLGPRSVVADVGCGTGISSRLLAARGLRVLGIEPNAEMREQAAAVPPPDAPAPAYLPGRAEATGLPAAAVDAVVAAQAFHWFEADAALREFHRILKPGGWVALMWNERDESDPFTAGYGGAVRATQDAAAYEEPRGRAGEPLLHHPLYEDAARSLFGHGQDLDEEGLLGRAFSASYAPRRNTADGVAFATALREVFARWQSAGRVTIRYTTSVYTGRRSVPSERASDLLGGRG
jgi:SAM-dependent methyltransferase